MTSTESMRRWRAANPGAATVLSRAWHKAHPGYAAARRKAHPGVAAAACAKWETSNPEKHRANTRKQNAKRYSRWLAIIQYLKAQPCHDCGHQLDRREMEFDHVPERGKKLFNIGCGDVQSIIALLAELEKCDLVCCLCHRKRTKGRK